MMARRSSSSWRSYGSCSVGLDPKMSPMHHCVPSMSMLCIYTYVCTHIPIPIYYFYMCMCDFRSDLAPTFLCCLVLAEAVCILARSFVRKHQSNNIHEHTDQKKTSQRMEATQKFGILCRIQVGWPENGNSFEHTDFHSSILGIQVGNFYNS